MSELASTNGPVANAGGADDAAQELTSDAVLTDYSLYAKESQASIPDAYNFPQINGSYLDDGTYADKPYRHMTNWSLTRKGQPKLRLAFSLSARDGKIARNMILYGELGPNPDEETPTRERLQIQLDRPLYWKIDRSHDERGIWIETKTAWYKLMQPCPVSLVQPDGKARSQEEVHIPMRAKFGLVSNLSDMLGELVPDGTKGPGRPMSQTHSQLTPKEAYDLLTPNPDYGILNELNLDPFDFELLRREAKFVRAQLRFFSKDLGPKCIFMKGLEDMEKEWTKAKKKLEPWTLEDPEFEASALMAEARSQRMPWGDMQPGVLTPAINELETIRRRERSAGKTLPSACNAVEDHAANTVMCTSSDGAGCVGDEREDHLHLLISGRCDKSDTPAATESNTEELDILGPPGVEFSDDDDDTSSSFFNFAPDPASTSGTSSESENVAKKGRTPSVSVRKRGRNGEAEKKRQRVTFAPNVVDSQNGNRNAKSRSSSKQRRTRQLAKEDVQEVPKDSLLAPAKQARTLRNRASRSTTRKASTDGDKSKSRPNNGSLHKRSTPSRITTRTVYPSYRLDIIEDPQANDYLSSFKVLKRRKELSKYVTCPKGGKLQSRVREDSDFLQDIICANTIECYFTMYIAIEALRNSSPRVIASLFSDPQPGAKESGCRAVFVTWMKEVERTMENRRRTPEGRAILGEMKETKMKHTEEQIAVGILGLIKVCCGPESVCKQCPRNVKCQFGVDLHRVVSDLATFAKGRYDMRDVSAACVLAKDHLHSIRQTEKKILVSHEKRSIKPRSHHSFKTASKHPPPPNRSTTPCSPTVHTNTDVLGGALGAKISYSPNKLIRDCDQKKMRRQLLRAQNTERMDMAEKLAGLEREHAILKGRQKRSERSVRTEEEGRAPKHRRMGKAASVLGGSASNEGRFNLRRTPGNSTSQQQTDGDANSSLASCVQLPSPSARVPAPRGTEPQSPSCDSPGAQQRQQGPNTVSPPRGTSQLRAPNTSAGEGNVWLTSPITALISPSPSAEDNNSSGSETGAVKGNGVPDARSANVDVSVPNPPLYNHQNSSNKPGYDTQSPGPSLPPAVWQRESDGTRSGSTQHLTSSDDACALVQQPQPNSQEASSCGNEEGNGGAPAGVGQSGDDATNGTNASDVDTSCQVRAAASPSSSSGQRAHKEKDALVISRDSEKEDHTVVSETDRQQSAWDRASQRSSQLTRSSQARIGPSFSQSGWGQSSRNLSQWNVVQTPESSTELDTILGPPDVEFSDDDNTSLLYFAPAPASTSGTSSNNEKVGKKGGTSAFARKRGLNGEAENMRKRVTFAPNVVDNEKGNGTAKSCSTSRPNKAPQNSSSSFNNEANKTEQPAVENQSQPSSESTSSSRNSCEDGTTLVGKHILGDVECCAVDAGVTVDSGSLANSEQELEEGEIPENESSQCAQHSVPPRSPQCTHNQASSGNESQTTSSFLSSSQSKPSTREENHILSDTEVSQPIDEDHSCKVTDSNMVSQPHQSEQDYGRDGGGEGLEEEATSVNCSSNHVGYKWVPSSPEKEKPLVGVRVAKDGTEEELKEGNQCTTS